MRLNGLNRNIPGRPGFDKRSYSTAVYWPDPKISYKIAIFRENFPIWNLEARILRLTGSWKSSDIRIRQPYKCIF